MKLPKGVRLIETDDLLFDSKDMVFVKRIEDFLYLIKYFKADVVWLWDNYYVLVFDVVTYFWREKK